jgi:hypothetical protein
MLAGLLIQTLRHDTTYHLDPRLFHAVDLNMPDAISTSDKLAT